MLIRKIPSNDSSSEKINYIFLDLFSEIQVEIENKMTGITLKSIMEKIK